MVYQLFGFFCFKQLFLFYLNCAKNNFVDLNKLKLNGKLHVGINRKLRKTNAKHKITDNESVLVFELFKLTNWKRGNELVFT